MNVPNIDYHSVRYTQEQLYPSFSNGKMSVSETYAALANGFLDPTVLPPIKIFEYNKHRYCIDTRRLTIAKELQRRKKFDILKRLPIQYVTKDDNEFANQYLNLVYERLPAMKKKGLDGSTVKLNDDVSQYMCCYKNDSGQFRDDLDEHIARDHLKMDALHFKKLNIFQCSQCNQKLPTTVHKLANKSFYTFIQNCACRTLGSLTLHTIEKPWTEVTLQEICDIFVRLNQNSLHEVEAVTLMKKMLWSQLLRMNNQFSREFFRFDRHRLLCVMRRKT